MQVLLPVRSVGRTGVAVGEPSHHHVAFTSATSTARTLIRRHRGRIVLETSITRGCPSPIVESDSEEWSVELGGGSRELIGLVTPACSAPHAGFSRPPAMPILACACHAERCEICEMGTSAPGQPGGYVRHSPLFTSVVGLRIAEIPRRRARRVRYERRRRLRGSRTRRTECCRTDATRWRRFGDSVPCPV